jgi:hypothetical protein
MSIWRRATDVSSLRKLARFAVVAAVAALLFVQVTGASAQVPSVTVPCPVFCGLELATCGNLCGAQLTQNTGACAANEGFCELVCVLTGFAFGPANAGCVAGCKKDQTACLAAAAATAASCVKGCQFNFQVCGLVCAFFNVPI